MALKLVLVFRNYESVDAMKSVTLQFKDERDLRRFYQVVTAPYIEMNARTLTITCECTSEDIELALKAFNATLVDDVRTL